MYRILNCNLEIGQLTSSQLPLPVIGTYIKQPQKGNPKKQRIRLLIVRNFQKKMPGPSFILAFSIQQFVVFNNYTCTKDSARSCTKVIIFLTSITRSRYSIKVETYLIRFKPVFLNTWKKDDYFLMAFEKRLKEFR